MDSKPRRCCSTQISAQGKKLTFIFENITKKTSTIPFCKRYFKKIHFKIILTLILHVTRTKFSYTFTSHIKYCQYIGFATCFFAYLLLKKERLLFACLKNFLPYGFLQKKE